MTLFVKDCNIYSTHWQFILVFVFNFCIENICSCVQTLTRSWLLDLVRKIITWTSSISYLYMISQKFKRIIRNLISKSWRTLVFNQFFLNRLSITIYAINRLLNFYRIHCYYEVSLWSASLIIGLVSNMWAIFKLFQVIFVLRKLCCEVYHESKSTIGFILICLIFDTVHKSLFMKN